MHRLQTGLYGLVLLVLVNSGWSNSALDLLEGKTDGRSLFPYFEESAEPAASPAPPAEKKREFVPSPFPQRAVPQLTLYHNDRSELIQEIAVDGLLQQGAVSGSWQQTQSDSRVRDEEFSNLRRARLGVALHALYFLDLEARVAFDADGYQGIDRLKATADLTGPMIPVHNTVQRGLRSLHQLAGFLLSPLQWISAEGDSFMDSYSLNPIEAARLSVGKFRPQFGSHAGTDPALHLAPDLPELVKQIAPGNTLGVQYREFNDHWNWTAGWFSSSLDEALPSIRGSGVYQFGLGYNFGMVEIGTPSLYSEFQEIRFDYFHNGDAGQSETVQGGYENLFALSVLSQNDRFTFSADLLLANGENSTLWGANLSAGFWVVRDFARLVGLYQHAHGTQDEGIQIRSGLSGAAGDTTHYGLSSGAILRGNEYHSFYAGLNLHLLESRLILGTGVEYQLLKSGAAGGAEYDSWTWQGNGMLTF